MSQASKQTTSSSTFPFRVPNNLLYLLGVSVFGGMVIGGVLFATSLLGYILLISPAFAGIGAGLLLKNALTSKKMSYPIWGFIFAIIMGTALYGTYWYGQYWDFKRTARNEILDTSPNLSDTEVASTIDSYLKDNVGRKGFLGFVLLQAANGWSIVVGPTYIPFREPIRLSSGETIAHWLIEIFCIFFVPVYLAREVTKQPFCHETNNWLRYIYVGEVYHADIEMFKEYVRTNRTQYAMGLIRNGLPYSRFEISVGCCHETSQEARLKINLTNKGTPQQIMDVQITRELFDAFEHYASL